MSALSRLAHRVLASPAGRLVALPWLDRLVLYLLKRWYFPLSRLWAAARAAEGDVDRFIEQVPLRSPTPSQRKRISKALKNFERRRLKAFSIEQLWRHYFFGRQAVAPERLPIVEEMRLDFRSDYNLARKNFAGLRKLVRTSVRMNPPTPSEVSGLLGAEGERLAGYFALPEAFPEVRVSRSVPASHGSDFWLRFASRGEGVDDMVYARVHQPGHVENPPTLIFGHGMCVEFDHYRQILDEITQLTRLGIRVIRPEAPWHGRRVLPGHYGGEQLLSRIPLSMFNFVAAQTREWATIIDWCKKNSSAPVAIGGSSLGAQSAKAIAMRASQWPPRLRPDALFLVTHSRHMAEAALEGALSDIWNLGAAMRAAGWHQQSEKSWLQRIDSEPGVPIKGEHIVTVLGTRDTVTPMATAMAQMDAWGVPPENRFSYRRGHFSVPLGLFHDKRPLLRFAAVLRQIERQQRKTGD